MLKWLFTWLFKRALKRAKKEPELKISSATQKLMMEDAKLPEEISLIGDITPCNKTQNILLIGATGIVGPHLLKSLLEQTEAEIYCLMHERHGDKAKEYLLSQLQRDRLFENLDTSRIHVIYGDIAKENLGLEIDTYQFLAKKADMIFHNAAWTNHMRPYSAPNSQSKADLRATNVLSVREALKLAARYKTKHFNLTSTIGAINRVDLDGWLTEEFPEASNKGDRLFVGYLQTKFVAEKLVMHAVEKGIPCRVFRLGQITGDSNTGISHVEKDHMMLELKACAQMGLAPDWQDGRSYVPSNIAADIIARIALKEGIESEVYNINNPQIISWLEIISTLNQRGHHIEVVPEHMWVEALAKADEKNALFPLKNVYSRPGKLTQLMPSLQLMFNQELHMERTLEALESSAVQFPSTRDLLEKYLDYFEKTKFITFN